MDILGAFPNTKQENPMKYLFMALVAVLFVAGCASDDPGTYKAGENDRHSQSQVSGNLRSPGPGH
jgi:hypothetical protein